MIRITATSFGRASSRRRQKLENDQAFLQDISWQTSALFPTRQRGGTCGEELRTLARLYISGLRRPAADRAGSRSGAPFCFRRFSTVI
jgi:hypothetical protein